MWCPAAPLVVAGLRRAGHRVRETSCLRLAACGEGELFAASYIDPDGHAIGLAAAAHQTDEAGLAAVREVIMTWSAVWRTRRVMVADIQDACTASPYAHEAAGATPDHRRRRIDLVPAQRGRTSGARMTMALAVDSVVGAVDDATCPHVDRAHAEAQRFADRGDHVVIIGQRDHAEASALLALTPERSVVVESEEDVAALRLPADRVSYVVQPGTTIEGAMSALASLRLRYPRSRGAHPDHLCYAASDRLETTRLVIGGSDLTILLGDPEEAASCATNAPTMEVLSDPTALQPSRLAAECIGVVPVGQLGVRLLPRLVTVLSGLGPLAVIHRRITTRTDFAGSWEMTNALQTAGIVENFQAK